jgi:RNA polymerase sigma-70 factor (ECF subfamily)
MSPVERQLLLHGAALRSLARDLVGACDADDLVQDVAVQALQRLPARGGDLRGWFVRIAQRLAGRQRRARMRRERHESRLPAPEPAPGSDRLPEHRDTVRALTDALLALPAPYQRVLLLRYFEDLTPTAIAERTAEPLATVKSRLQRGLILLRERLDAGERRDWRPAFAAMCGVRAASTGAAAATGVLLMGTGAKCALGGLAAMVAIAMAFWLRGPDPQPRANARTAQAAQPGVQQASAVAAATAAEPQQRQEVAPPPTVLGPLGAITGRCVDDDGQPVAGAHVRGRLRHRAPGAQDVGETDAVSTADGAFSLPVGAGAEIVMLAIDSDGACPVSSMLDAPAPGKVLALGDIVLPVAIRIRGRVVDEQGMGQAAVALQACCVASERPRVHPSGVVTMTSRDDGTFGPSEPLPSGNGYLVLTNRSLAHGTTVELKLQRERRMLDLEVVVLQHEPLGISGIVVDEAGRPLTDVRFVAGTEAWVSTHADGTFTASFLAERGPGPFVVSAGKDGYEDAIAPPLPRGTTDAKLVLRRAAGLRVRVVADEDSRPVPVFTALLMGPAPTHAGIQLYREQTWPDGMAQLPGVTGGEYSVWVNPADERLSPSGFVPVKVVQGLPAELEVRLEPRRGRLLHVQDADGRAAAAVDVELIDPVGQPLGLDTYAYAPDQRRVYGAQYAAPLLQAGATDSRGELMLRGPARRELALRLRGGGCSLQLVRPVALAGDSPLVVRAERQARWLGRLVPVEVGSELVRLHGHPDDPRGAVGLSLWRDGDSMRRRLDPPLPIAADGTFAVDGIPSGTWQVNVMVDHSAWHAAEIKVAEGQELHQDVDVTPLRPVQLDLRVTVDGQPYDGNINTVAWHAMGRSGQRMGSSGYHHTNADGHLLLDTFGGTLLCNLYVLDDGGDRQIVTTPSFTVPAGGHVDHWLDVAIARAALQVARPDGEAAAGVELALSEPGVARDDWRVLRADDKGLARIPRAVAGRWQLVVRPRSLGTEAAQREFASKRSWEALRAEWVDVAAIDLVPGTAAHPIRVQLPAAWDR